MRLRKAPASKSETFIAIGLYVLILYGFIKAILNWRHGGFTFWPL